jgi:FlaA1/EpsC-like NDP-sugar epimerase
VVGSSGALGLELCRQILRFAPERLLVLERYEPSLTTLVSHLQQTFPAARITPILCDPIGNAKLEEVFAEHRPQVVFQNAMRKYLPFFSFQTQSVLRANYLGTFALAQQAAHCGCTHFVLVSSETAHHRGTVIADSLRAVEIGLQQSFAPTSTRLVIVRLGDILENHSGLVARLEEHIVNREPVILPHREVKCALLSKRAAVHFILDALGLAESLAPRTGIFVCPQAAVVPVLDVARQLALLHNVQLGTDMPLYFLHEPPSAALLEETQEPYAHMRLLPTSNPSISLLQEIPLASPVISEAVQALLRLQEHDLASDGWEYPTRILLECVAQASRAA